MKKLGLMLGLAACVTVGGVYATWSFSGNDVVDATKDILIGITGATTTEAEGKYDIDASNIKLIIDQAAINSHKAVLIFADAKNSAGDVVTPLADDATAITVKFTPSANAPQTVKKSAVPTWYSFNVTTAMQYSMDSDGNYLESGTATDIFTFNNSGFDSTNGFAVTWKACNTDGSEWTSGGEAEFPAYFTYSITTEQLKAIIGINDFILDTKTEYEKFKGVLVGDIRMTVTDHRATTGTSN
jgi:hypothetical protein